MMEIYNEQMERIESPDLSLGRLERSTRTVHHEAVQGVEEVWHYETVAEYENGGKDVEKVIDVPGVEAQAAYDEEIPILIYHPYTQEELDAIEAEREKLIQEQNAKEQRLAALEAQLAAYEAAYTEGVNEA